jgi:uncharacterized phage-associated protein
MSALTAAETLVEIGGKAFSNLQIQKLLYLAQMFYLGQNSKAMFDDDFEAWKLGPVIPSVYQNAKIYGSRPVGNLFTSRIYPTDSSEYAMLEKIVRELPDKSPWKLVSITHWDKGAWAKNYTQGDFGCAIPKTDILEEYEKRVQLSREKRDAIAN